MKNGKIRIWSLMICSFSSIAARAQTISHRDALVYYTGIALQVKDILPKVRDIWGSVQLTMMAAGESRSHQANPADIDHLKNAYSQNLRDLERALRAVNALEETDIEINLKQVVSAYLSDIRQAEETALPKILLLLGTGIDKINDQQTNMLKGFLYKGQELQKGLSMIENLTGVYQKKYNITAEELRTFGL